MNTHTNARLTICVAWIVSKYDEGGVSASEAVCKHSAIAMTARKWLSHYLASGAAGQVPMTWEVAACDPEPLSAGLCPDQDCPA